MAAGLDTLPLLDLAVPVVVHMLAEQDRVLRGKAIQAAQAVDLVKVGPVAAGLVKQAFLVQPAAVVAMAMFGSTELFMQVEVVPPEPLVVREVVAPANLDQVLA